MLGVILGVLTVGIILATSHELVDPYREQDFMGGYWTGFIAAIVCTIVNIIW